MANRDNGQTISASNLHFTERTVTPTGKEGHRSHHYAWGRCLVCNDVQLVRRAGLIKRRCVMTPGCHGLLTPAEDALELGGPVDRAVAAFDATVIDVVEKEAS